MVEVNLIAGFLGAGKTSAVAHLLSTLGGQRVGVVVNDFGEASIDGALLDGAELREITGSCVCCTAPEGFVAAVRDLASRVDRILVEPTGLARPADLVDSLRRAAFVDRLSIGPLVVLVDPHLLATGGVPPDVLRQTAMADVLVANRTDLASPEELEVFRQWAADAWPGPLRVIETVHGRLPPDVLSWPPDGRRTGIRAVAPDAPAHGDAFGARSWIWSSDVVFRRSRLVAALSDPGLVRAKGLFRTDEGVLELQWAGERLHEAPSDWRRDSRLDAIVRGRASDALDRLDRALGDAVLDASAARARGSTLEVALGDAGRTFDRAALAALPDGVSDVGAFVPGRSGSAARLREILGAVGAPADARLVVVARDGFTTPPTPLDTLSDALVVHSLGDSALPDAQGGPFRLLVPGGAGPCANIKAVVRLALR
jgi:G3E family GTPase